MKLRHKQTGIIGTFVSRCYVSGKYDSTIVQLETGKYAAPTEEFEEVK